MATSLLFLTRHFSPARTPDRELLDRFASTRDNEAFAELVRRHGPVVYRICRSLVGDASADDAFQATFLLLATRTTAARAANSVGGWLVGVAGRVARQMRRSAHRRTRRERIAASQSPREGENAAPELLDQFRILDEELARLPDHLRDPVVLCLLQGQSQEHAAHECGYTTRTVRRRLEEARRILRSRLQRRGVTPALAAGLVLGLESVSIAVTGALAARTVAVVFDFLTGGAASHSPPALVAKGVATTMLSKKLMAMMAIIAVGMTGLGIVLADEAGQGQPVPAPAPHVKQFAVPQPTPDPAQSTPRQPMPIPALSSLLPTTPRQAPPIRLPYEVEKQLEELQKTLKPGESKVLIEVQLVEVPADFCLDSGLTLPAELNIRERKMLDALIRAKPKCSVLNRHQLTLASGQNYTIESRARTDEMRHVSINVSPFFQKITVQVFQTLALTIDPTILPGDRQHFLKIHVSCKKPLSTTQDEQSIATMETIQAFQSHETLVFSATAGSPLDKNQNATFLWLLTTHVVQAKP